MHRKPDTVMHKKTETLMHRVLHIMEAVIAIMTLIVIIGMLGYEVYNVISGSMEPTYSKGDLIYVKAVDPYQIKEGDVITFVLNEQLVVATHRVIRVDAPNRSFYTKGDANNTPDQKPVRFENVKGVPQFSIPLLGYVSDYISHPPGTYVAIGAVVVMMGIAFIPDMFAKKPEETQAEGNDKEPAAAGGDDKKEETALEGSDNSKEETK